MTEADGSESGRTAVSTMQPQTSILNGTGFHGEENMKRFDVLRYYDENLPAGKQLSSLSSSLFRGGIDTGMDIGKFTIDTTNNINNKSSGFSNDPQQPS